MEANELEFTGERLTTKINEYWSIEHLHRYAIAMDLVYDKSVLDIASGEGYGTYLMAGRAKSIIGVDISETAVTHSTKKYRKSNLSFKKGSASNIPLEDNSVEIVTSFETIEHHDQHEKMIEELSRVLVAEGIIIISSPDKKYYSDVPGYNNPFHIKELYANDFEQLVKKYFKNTLMLNQKTIFGSVISKARVAKEQLSEFSGNYDKIDRTETITESPYNICIASNGTLDTLSISNSIFSSKDLFAMYTQLKDQNLIFKKKIALLESHLRNPLRMLYSLLKSPINKRSKK